MAKEIQITYKAIITEIYKDVDEQMLDPEEMKALIIEDLEQMVKNTGAVPAVTIKDFKVFVIDGEETT